MKEKIAKLAINAYLINIFYILKEVVDRSVV